ncbi:MAG TPA: carbon-nitrogen hydrolase family protein [Cyclobacteriaceae bacterium]|nr:carbon-nitrogen hydrolase family protein [Cyclobacteriaceae bacterium]
MKAIIFLSIFCVLIPGPIIIGKPGENVPSEWWFECHRDAIAPVYQIDQEVKFRDEPTLYLSGGGKEYADGRWTKEQKINSGEYYKFNVFYKAQKVDEPERCILGRILWLDVQGKQVGEAEYPIFLREKSREGWNMIGQVYLVPQKVNRAKIELVYRWDADGEVRFGGFSFEKSDPVKPRLVRLGTAHYKPHRSTGWQENLEKYAELVRKAAAEKADIVCLPESITMVGTGLGYVQASQPIPGPATDFLGKVARENQIYIVAGILEKSGNEVFNSSVLIDRNGELAGVYHKVSLPREEIDGGITPGNSLPVFDTDFGRIGMMICWDVTFPEVARGLAREGAEIILMPIAGGNLTLASARAIENQVYLVSSTYDMKSAVFDLEGKILVEATHEDPVAVTEVDLNRQKLWPWLGDFKNRIFREIPSGKAVGSK